MQRTDYTPSTKMTKSVFFLKIVILLGTPLTLSFNFSSFFLNNFQVFFLSLSLDFLPRGDEVVEFYCQCHSFAGLGPESQLSTQIFADFKVVNCGLQDKVGTYLLRVDCSLPCRSVLNDHRE